MISVELSIDYEQSEDENCLFTFSEDRKRTCEEVQGMLTTQKLTYFELYTITVVNKQQGRR